MRQDVVLEEMLNKIRLKHLRESSMDPMAVSVCLFTNFVIVCYLKIYNLFNIIRTFWMSSHFYLLFIFHFVLALTDQSAK